MTTDAVLTRPRPVSRQAAIPNPILGMLLFTCTELMFFMALISAHTVIKSGAGVWAPPESVRLPLLTTGFNTAVLIASGFCLFMAGRLFHKSHETTRNYLTLSFLLGLFFVVFQGYEWVGLIRYGMTMSSGVFGATFFLLIGSHGLHALAGALALGFFAWFHAKGKTRLDQLRALQIFWFFIVGIWPLFYKLVYFARS